MRILFVSNYLSNSGYARQARLIVPAIIAAGHEVEVLSIANLHVRTITNTPDGVKLLPLAQDPLGNDIVRHHYKAGNFDAVITFTDVWGLNADVYKDLNWYPITPIDTYTLAPQHAANIRASKFPIAISWFGHGVIQDETGMDAHYLPMLVDTDFWKPADKTLVRSMLNIPQDKIVFMFVGTNHDVPSRKGIPELLQAWARCGDKLGDSAYLHMHTDQHGAVDIVAMARQLKIPPERLKVTPPAQYHLGYDDDMMLLMAQSADCLIQPSRREGACLPLIEYQACGIPVIASDAHAQAEYNKGAYSIGGQRTWSVMGAWEFVPLSSSIEYQIMEFMKHKDKPVQNDIRQTVIDEHSIQAVTANYLQPILEAISMDVLSRE